MSTKHSPAPWTRKDGQGAPDAHAVWVVDAQGRTLFETSSLDSAEQDAAFDVASAAPELLEALKLARSALSKASDVETFRAVSAAIARAEGES